MSQHVQWLEDVTSALHRCIEADADNLLCSSCFLPSHPSKLPPPDSQLHFDHENYKGCPDYLFPHPISLLLTSYKREAILAPADIYDSLAAYRWLATPVYVKTDIYNLHLLFLFHHFHLPSTRYSPLTTPRPLDPSQPYLHGMPYDGPSFINNNHLTMMESIEFNTIMGMLRPTYNVRRTTTVIDAAGGQTKTEEYYDE